MWWALGDRIKPPSRPTEAKEPLGPRADGGLREIHPPARSHRPLGGKAEGATDGSPRSASVAQCEHERRGRGGGLSPSRPSVMLGSCGDARISIPGPKNEWSAKSRMDFAVRKALLRTATQRPV